MKYLFERSSSPPPQTEAFAFYGRMFGVANTGGYPKWNSPAKNLLCCTEEPFS